MRAWWRSAGRGGAGGLADWFVKVTCWTAPVLWRLSFPLKRSLSQPPVSPWLAHELRRLPRTAGS